MIGTPLQTNLICPIGCVQAQIEKGIKSWHGCIAAIMPGAACLVNSPGYPGQVVGVSLAPLSSVVRVCELTGSVRQSLTSCMCVHIVSFLLHGG